MVTLLVGAAFLVLRIGVIIPPLIIALFLAYFISLGIPWVQRNTGWSRGVAAILTEIFILLLLFTVPALITPWLVNAVNGFIGTLSKVINELLSATPKPIEVTPSLVINLGPFYQPINAWLRSVVGPELGNLENLQGLQGLEGLLPQFTSGVTTVLKGAISGFIYFFFILVIAFYTARDGWRLGRFVSERVPDEWRPELGRLWRELAMIWDSFVRGQLLLALTVGLVVWLSMTILGVRNAPVLGLISAVLEFVPSIGPVLAAIPGVAIALVLGSSWLPLPNVWFAALVAFVYVLIQQVENLYLLPRVVGARIRLHPAVVILGALVGGALAGILGILLAAPTIAVRARAARLCVSQDHRISSRSSNPRSRTCACCGASWCGSATLRRSCSTSTGRSWRQTTTSRAGSRIRSGCRRAFCHRSAGWHWRAGG